jgi:hypothetical protein
MSKDSKNFSSSKLFIDHNLNSHKPFLTKPGLVSIHNLILRWVLMPLVEVFNLWVSINLKSKAPQPDISSISTSFELANSARISERDRKSWRDKLSKEEGMFHVEVTGVKGKQMSKTGKLKTIQTEIMGDNKVKKVML